MIKTAAFPIAIPPQPEKRPVFDTHHGFTRIDDYAWLRAENTYQATLMADTAELRKQLFAEMKGRIKEDDSTVPMKDGAYAYGSSFRLGGEQPRYFRTP